MNVPACHDGRPQRRLLAAVPHRLAGDNVWARGLWPASWIAPAEHHDGTAQVTAYRLRFTLTEQAAFRIHVSADQRYQLTLDHRPIARGPERGDLDHWSFETFDLDLAAGEHLLFARVWWLPVGWPLPCPHAQFTRRPAFLLHGDLPGKPGGLDTGTAAWEVRDLPGYAWLTPQMAWGSGAKLHLHGPAVAWDAERGEGDGWRPPVTLERARVGETFVDGHARWLLTPAQLPAMTETTVPAGTARHVEDVPAADTTKLATDPARHRAADADAWNRLLAGDAPLTIPANTRRRVLVDLGDYYTAYPELVAEGAGARVRILWAEGLYETDACRDNAPKGRRDVCAHKFFWGIGDTFDLTGEERTYTTLWWEAGRWLEILVETADAPATLSSFRLRQTGFPLAWRGDFACDDPRLEAVIPLARRTLERCAHETYMDCPYYEQLMYVGDTRLEILATYAFAGDDRLPRKALALFDWSRTHSGLTRSRYPSNAPQTIPPFSLWWIGMVRDFAFWRDDPATVRALLPGVRAVLDAFAARLDADGRLHAVEGWNFVDWVPGWTYGMPLEADRGVSAVVGWQFALACMDAAAIEDAHGDPECAARARRLARRAAAGCEDCWDETRGLYADSAAKTTWSEHAQILALLSGHLSHARAERVGAALIAAVADPSAAIARTTIYFSHYLFEVLGQLDRTDLIIARMGLWFEHRDLGMTTLREQPEPSRSDCHAWGAHPLYHYLATILGIRPFAPGFARVLIAPRLGPLNRASGTLPHPQGDIVVALERRNGALHGTIDLPPGLSGDLWLAEALRPLAPGRTVIGTGVTGRAQG
jgi:hypothetical protein